MLFIAFAAALASGFSMPLMVILYGRVTKAMVNSGITEDFCNTTTTEDPSSSTT